MKASGSIYAKLNFVPGVYMLRGCNKYNIKRVNLANQQITPKRRRRRVLRRRVMWAKKITKSDKLIEKEGDFIYQEDFEYYLVDFVFLFSV